MCSCFYGLVMDVLPWTTVGLAIVATVITSVLMTLAITTETLCDKTASNGSIQDVLDELNKPPVSAGISISADKIEDGRGPETSACVGRDGRRHGIVLFAAVIELVYWNCGLLGLLPRSSRSNGMAVGRDLVWPRAREGRG